MTAFSETVLRETDDPNIADEWLLVLTAEGFSPEVYPTPPGFAVTVPNEQSEMAFVILSEYEKENSSNRREPHIRPDPPRFEAGLAVAAVIVIFHTLTVGLFRDVPWLGRGSADASKLIHGQLWRAVTALTLHADFGHAFGNALAAALLFSALASVLGWGVSLMIVLVTGAVGNLVNAYFHAPPHVSIGASTAIFAAVGLFGSIATFRNRQLAEPRRRSLWAPPAAAIALLCLLGTTGERVDVLAHLLGFVSGALGGVVIAGLVFAPPDLCVQVICGSAAAALLVGCWIAALA
jgi:rhomboid protease GluP